MDASSAATSPAAALALATAALKSAAAAGTKNFSFHVDQPTWPRHVATRARALPLASVSRASTVTKLPPAMQPRSRESRAAVSRTAAPRGFATR